MSEATEGFPPPPLLYGFAAAYAKDPCSNWETYMYASAQRALGLYKNSRLGRLTTRPVLVASSSCHAGSETNASS